MLKNNYAEFMQNSALRAMDFQRLARLVHQVPVKRIVRPNGLDALADLLALIRADFE